MLLTLILVVLFLVMIGALPQWPYAGRYGYGYAPSGLLALLIVLVIALLLLGYI